MPGMAAHPGTLTGYTTSDDNQHVNYFDGNGHVHELPYTDGGHWQDTDLTEAARSPSIAARLFLESIGDNKTNRASILIGATSASVLATATRQIESNGSVGCPVASPAEIDCVSFNKETAVSLLSSLWINGRLIYLPLGTSLYYVVETVSRSEHEQARALETISLGRPLATGGYAEVIFPPDLGKCAASDSAQRRSLDLGTLVEALSH
jgi:hypothetical protein